MDCCIQRINPIQVQFQIVHAIRLSGVHNIYLHNYFSKLYKGVAECVKFKYTHC